MISNMNIEWWMLDGLIGLVMLIAMLRGIIKGIGDTVFRLIGLAGGLALCVFYSDRVSEYLSGTPLKTILYDHIYQILLPGTEEAAGQATEAAGDTVADMMGQTQTNPLMEFLPKSLGGLVSEIAHNTADAAADRLTQIAISIFSVVAIMLAVWLGMALIRLIYKYFRDESFVIGFVDRLLGLVLGIIRGTVIACIVIAALIPVTTIFAPDKVPEILEAMKDTYLAGIIYDINPLMLLVKYLIG